MASIFESLFLEGITRGAWWKKMDFFAWRTSRHEENQQNCSMKVSITSQQNRHTCNHVLNSLARSNWRQRQLWSDRWNSVSTIFFHYFVLLGLSFPSSVPETFPRLGDYFACYAWYIQKIILVILWLQVFDEAVRAVLRPEPQKRHQRKCLIM